MEQRKSRPGMEAILTIEPFAERTGRLPNSRAGGYRPAYAITAGLVVEHHRASSGSVVRKMVLDVAEATAIFHPELISPLESSLSARPGTEALWSVRLPNAA